MPRVALTATQPNKAGVAAPTEADGDPTNGHVVRNSGRTVIVVRNADAGGAHTVTFVIPGTVDGQPIGDRTVSIPASTTRYFSGFSANVYGGSMGIDVDSTQLKLSAFEP